MTNNSRERSIKDRVKKIALEQDREFAAVWMVVILERWLVRLCRSEHKDLFTFKGGMCLSQYLNIGRDTKDLDFLIKGVSASRDSLEKIFTEVSAVVVEDGIVFTSISVNNLSHAHMKYPGFEITMRAELGQTRTPIRIDIGIGDVVTPENLTIYLSKNQEAPLFEKEVQLWAYPPEVIFAEKLETAVKRDALNSRMKDYHDLVLLVQGDLLNLEQTKLALRKTFKHRGTKLTLLREFSKIESERLENLWKNHLKNIKNKAVLSKIPSAFSDAVLMINDFVIKAIK
jgi:predicted nucleotidyltransferase component of viral defense system